MKDFKKAVKYNSDTVLYKRQRMHMFGVGTTSEKIRKNGQPYANASTCSTVVDNGYLFIPTKHIAGLKFTPPNSKWVSAHGFTVLSKTNLDTLLQEYCKR